MRIGRIVQNRLTSVLPRFKLLAHNAVKPVSSDIIEAGRIDISGVNLPSKAVDGLVTIQMDEMKRAVVTVNQNLAVAGAAMRQAMEDLYMIKTGVLGTKRKGNWIAFLESGLLNISPKTARDLVAAYDNWIKKEGDSIPDYVFSNMTARTLAVISAGSDDAKSIVLAKVRSGEKITEAEARRLVSEKKKTKVSEEAGSFFKAETDWDKYCESQIEEIQQDTAMTPEVKAEKVKRLEAKQKNMKMIGKRFAKIRKDIKELQKLVYSSVEGGNKFKKNTDPFLTYYSKLLKESGVDVVDIEEGVANLQELNEASKLFSSADTSETVSI